MQSISNFLWRFAERCGAQAVTFVVSIVLARILEPSDYGTVALITVIISLMNVFIDSGLGNSLIQKLDADDTDYSTVFYTNLALCLCFYCILFCTAPYIARIYKDDSMIALIRVLGISIIVSGVKNIQQAYVSKNLLFKRFFFSTLCGTIGASIIGITFAFCGFGVWALVIQSLFNNIVDTVILWFTVKWRPKKIFSFKRLKGLFSYGWKLLASNILNSIYDNLRTLIIGKVYSTKDLAYYNRGNSLPYLFIDNINSSISSVLFPTMSKVQDNVIKMKEMTRLSIKVSVYILAPIMMGLCFVGDSVITLLLTKKWQMCVPYMRIFCIAYMFYPIHTSNLSAIKAMGRSDLFLKLEVFKKIVGLTVLIITIPISVMAMTCSLLITNVISQIINSWPNRRLLNYGYLEQLKDILPGILLAVAMGCCIYPIQWLGLPDIVTLCIQVPLGAVIYIGGSIIFKLDSFNYLWGIVKPSIMKVLHKT